MFMGIVEEKRGSIVESEKISEGLRIDIRM